MSKACKHGSRINWVGTQIFFVRVWGLEKFMVGEVQKKVKLMPDVGQGETIVK